MCQSIARFSECRLWLSDDSFSQRVIPQSSPLVCRPSHFASARVPFGIRFVQWSAPS